MVPGARFAVTVVAAIAAVVAALPPAASPATPRPQPAAAERQCVGVVVDFGTLRPTGGADPGGRGSADGVCVPVSDRATGADVLAARAKALRRPGPRYNDRGLLCAIDGLPATGCGEPASGGGYRYWSYWQRRGDGPWTYRTTGPLEARITGDRPVEGWAWVDGRQASRRPAALPWARLRAVAAPPSTPRAARPADSGERSLPIGVIVGVALVVGLAAAAIVRARRR